MSEISESALVSLDYECVHCVKTVERVVKKRDRDSQKCECGRKMVALFPIGKQLVYETTFKPFVDYVTSNNEKVITSKGDWRRRLKESKSENIYKGGGRTLAPGELDAAKKLIERGDK